VRGAVQILGGVADALAQQVIDLDANGSAHGEEKVQPMKSANIAKVAPLAD
jgi:hypothetical protein